MDETTVLGVQELIGRMCIVFKGGVTYSDFMEMTLPEFYSWAEIASKIVTEQNNQLNKA